MQLERREKEGEMTEVEILNIIRIQLIVITGVLIGWFICWVLKWGGK